MHIAWRLSPSTRNEGAFQSKLNRFLSVEPGIYHSPSFEDLEKPDAEPEDELKVINEKIKMLGENHLKDLERLYTIQAIDYKADVKNQYLSFDESELENPGTEISTIEVISHDGQLSVLDPTYLSSLGDMREQLHQGVLHRKHMG